MEECKPFYVSPAVEPNVPTWNAATSTGKCSPPAKPQTPGIVHLCGYCDRKRGTCRCERSFWIASGGLALLGIVELIAGIAWILWNWF